jgi:integrase
MSVQVREKPKGSGIYWLFVCHQGHRKAKRIGPDMDYALEMAAKVEEQLAAAQMPDPAEKKDPCPTLRQYVFGWKDELQAYPGWIHEEAKFCLKDSTKTGYRNILKAYILPALGKLPMDEITPKLVKGLVFKLLRQGIRSNTAKNVKNCLGAVLRSAKEDGYLTSLPTRDIKVPRPEGEEPLREPTPFTWKERDHLETVYRDHYRRYYPLIVCGFRTGLRIGELLSLQWDDLDFFNGLIRVQRNISRGKVTSPKTKSSTRQVRMTSQLKSVLEWHRQQVIAEKLKKGWREMPPWVFVNEEGGFLNYGNFVHRVWNRAITKSGLSHRTPHDMRHTYATLRLSKGDPLAEVSKEMGHGTPIITYRTYYKWLPSESRTNIDELDSQGEDLTGCVEHATTMQPDEKRGLRNHA